MTVIVASGIIDRRSDQAQEQLRSYVIEGYIVSGDLRCFGRPSTMVGRVKKRHADLLDVRRNDTRQIGEIVVDIERVIMPG